MESHVLACNPKVTHTQNTSQQRDSCLPLLSSIAQMLSNTLRKPLTLAQLHDVRTDSMADDVDINYDVMKAWTCEQAAAYLRAAAPTRHGRRLQTSIDDMC